MCNTSRLTAKAAKRGRIYESIANSGSTYLLVRVHRDNTVDVKSTNHVKLAIKHTYRNVPASAFYAEPIE